MVDTFHSWLYKNLFRYLNCCLCVSDVKGANWYRRMCPWSKFQSEIALTTYYKTAKKRRSVGVYGRVKVTEREKNLLLNKLASSIFMTPGCKVVLGQTTVSRTLSPPTQKQFTQPRKLGKSKKEVRNRQSLRLTSFALSATVRLKETERETDFWIFRGARAFAPDCF